MRKEVIRPNDYEQRERPKTRRAQFFDLARHRFLDLFKISLLQAVFLMPLLTSIIIFYLLIRNTTDFNAFFTVALIQGGSLLISMPIVFIGLSGTFYAMKLLAYGEGGFSASSFFIGMKEGWKRGLLIGIVEGMSASLTVIGGAYLLGNKGIWGGWFTGGGIAILIIQLMVMTMINYYTLSQNMIYENPLGAMMKNSLIMVLLRFPFNLLFFILHPGIFLALISIMEITMYVGIGIIIFFSAFGHLIWMLNTIVAFDKYINKENYPDYVNKGLYKENKEV